MSLSGFSVSPAQVADAAQTYTDNQQTAPDLGNQVQATGVVNTGDPGLDSLVQQTMNDLAQVCAQVGQAMSTTATALNQVADGYQSTDATVAGFYASVMSSSDDTNVPMM
jgi:type VII secretion effector (TIGR04197 family)